MNKHFIWCVVKKIKRCVNDGFLNPSRKENESAKESKKKWPILSFAFTELSGIASSTITNALTNASKLLNECNRLHNLVLMSKMCPHSGTWMSTAKC